MNKCAMSDTYRDKNLQAILGRKDKDSESIKLKLLCVCPEGALRQISRDTFADERTKLPLRFS
jgi:hypothetical protein